MVRRKRKIIVKGGTVLIDLGEDIIQMSERSEDATVLMKQFANFQAAKTRQGFDEQRRGVNKWEPRGGDGKIKNLAGMLEDLKAGASKPKSRRFDATPALRDTSQLMMSVTPARGASWEKFEATAGTIEAERAQKLQDGAEINIKIDRAMRKKLIDLGNKDPELQEQLDNLIVSGEYKSNIKPRVIFHSTDEDIETMIKFTEVYFGLRELPTG